MLIRALLAGTLLMQLTVTAQQRRPSQAPAPNPFDKVQSSAPASWRHLTNLEVRATQLNREGEEWDAVVPILLGPLMPSIGGPAPDMLVLLFDGRGSIVSLTKTEAQSAQRNNCTMTEMITSPARCNSAVRCPNSFNCTFGGILLPDDYVGLVVIDLDIKVHDFVSAGILRTGKAHSPQLEIAIEDAIHAFLKSMEEARIIQGAPSRNSEFPVAAIGDCAKTSCFSSGERGSTDVYFFEPKTAAPGNEKECGMSMKGEVVHSISESGEGEFELRFSENQCRGRVLVEWDFGDSTQPMQNPGAMVTHKYATKGDYTVAATPKCWREISVCRATTAHSDIQVK